MGAFFLEHLGFGDFVFRDEKGRAIDRADNLIDFERKLHLVPDESLLYHAGRNHFSNWIMARSEVKLAKLCQRQALQRFTSAAGLRRYLTTLIHDELQKRQRGIVTQFSERDFDAGIMEFVKCGKGAMGGKAQGLAFFSNYLQRTKGLADIQQVRIAVPPTLVVTTEAFDQFIRENNLAELHRQSKTDDEDYRDYLSIADCLNGCAVSWRFCWSKSTTRSSSVLQACWRTPISLLMPVFSPRYC